MTVGGNRRCLELLDGGGKRKLVVNDCADNNRHQRWEWGNVNRTMLALYDETGPKAF